MFFYNFVSDTHFAILLRADSDLDLMYTCSARILFLDMHFTVLLCSDTDFGLMYTRSFKNYAFINTFRCFLAF